MKQLLTRTAIGLLIAATVFVSGCPAPPVPPPTTPTPRNSATDSGAAPASTDYEGVAAVKTIESKVEQTVENVKEDLEAAERTAENAFEIVTETAKGAVEDVKSAAEPVVEEAVETATEAVKETEKAIENVIEKAEESTGPELGAPAPQPAETDTSTEPTAPARKPALFATLPEDMHGPDGMTVSDKTGTIFLSVPNFNGREGDTGPKKTPAVLAVVKKDGTVEKILEFPVLDATGQTGPMGLDMGPDGHLYVCDNQYFFDKDHKSRVLRVVMDGDTPTGKVEVVADGLKLANALLWTADKMYVSDTFLDLPEKFGAGGIWAFAKDEALKAGTEGNETIMLKPNGEDPRLIVKEEVAKVGRDDNAGFDGIATGPDGTLYAGNFGNGALYAIRFDGEGKPQVEMIHDAGDVFACCDGIFYDKETDRIYINDSAANAIRAFKPTQPGEKAVLELVWENGDTDGADGSLDQPCECVVIDGKMYIVNFDWPFPAMKNTKFDLPSTISVIDLK